MPHLQEAARVAVVGHCLRGEEVKLNHLNTPRPQPAAAHCWQQTPCFVRVVCTQPCIPSVLLLCSPMLVAALENR